MAFIPALNTMRVTISMTLSGKIVVCVVYANKETTIFESDLETIANTVKDWWANELAPLVSGDIALSKVEARDMTTSAGQMYTLPVAPPIYGEAVGQAMSNNVALVLSWRTAYAGRSQRGRTYIPGISESSVHDSRIDTIGAGLFATAGAALTDAILTAGYLHVVASFRHNGAPRATAQLTPVQACVVNTRVDTQRKRLPRV